MIRKIFVIIFLCFAFSDLCLSQVSAGGNTPVLFHGAAFDASSQLSLAGVEIQINRIRSAPSSADGTFSFYAFKRDTVLFSMLGYKSLSFFISDSLSGRDFLTGVYLEADTIFIGEVIIIPKLTNLKAELLNPRMNTDPKMENAVANINTASYVARTTPGKLGDPASNYEYIRHKSKIDAYEKGGIPSERILGLNPLILIPAAYLLLHGTPSTPPAPKPQISSKDLEELKKMYQESLKARKR